MISPNSPLGMPARSLPSSSETGSQVLIEPTLEQICRVYCEIARLQRMKTGRPQQRTMVNAVSGFWRVCHAAGLSDDSPLSLLTRHALDRALLTFLNRGKRRITALGYFWNFHAIFARWAMPYYEDAGWRIPPLKMPVIVADPLRYHRPSEEKLHRVKLWYEALGRDAKRRRMWFAATMMLEFAMRNGDVMRLKDENFACRDDTIFLCYQPHKTARSSGREVVWPVHPTIWQRILALGGVKKCHPTMETFYAMNCELRRLGFTGGKASYELRKICIDHVYQRFGAEMATSISGDNIATVSRYYADPTRPNVGPVRIIDLIG